MKEICRKALSFLKNMTVKQKIISASVVAVILITAILVPIIIVNTGKCDHVFDNACDTTCNECGETREVGAHDYNAADCDTPKTCKICGATDGEALGHTAEADDGNCTTDIKCATCGAVVASGKTQHVAHADDGDILGLEGLVRLGKGAGLAGTSGGVILGVKIKHNFLASEVRKRYGLPVLVRQCKIGGDVSYLQHIFLLCF